jgi:hypothetical protein
MAMVSDDKTVSVGHLQLQVFNLGFFEFHNFAARGANQVVVVALGTGKFIAGKTIIEMTLVSDSALR